MPDAGFFIITTGLSILAFLIGLGIGRARRRAAVGAYVLLLGLLLAAVATDHMLDGLRAYLGST